MRGKLVSQVVGKTLGSRTETFASNLQRKGFSFFSRPLTQVNHPETVIKPEIIPSIRIPRGNMVPLERWNNNDRLELMFATKPGLPIYKFPISHSAIAFRSGELVSIEGRQSPKDPSNWFKHGISLRTMMDNEFKYLHPNFEFTGHPTGVYFTKKEIQQFLKETDEAINQPQICNMVNSNCYSASTHIIILAMNNLLKQPKFNAEDINKLLAVFTDHPLQDHFSFGVRNNQIVMAKLSSVLNGINERAASIQNPTSTEKALHQWSKQLIDELFNDNLTLKEDFARRDILGM